MSMYSYNKDKNSGCYQNKTFNLLFFQGDLLDITRPLLSVSSDKRGKVLLGNCRAFLFRS